MAFDSPAPAPDVIFAAAGTQTVGGFMSNARTALSIGLVASAVSLAIVVASPAEARTKYRQQPTARTGYPVQYSYGTPGVYRNTPPGNIVCWTPCGQPGSIVMGADPDPFIRQQILRDASGFFGGGGR
jgi:hypothetical protein